MEPQEILDIAREALYVTLKISAPIMLIALFVGLLISLFQALTQIQEATLSFVPKIIAILICLIFLLPFMSANLKLFAEHLNEKIIEVQ